MGYTDEILNIYNNPFISKQHFQGKHDHWLERSVLLASG